MAKRKGGMPAGFIDKGYPGPMGIYSPGAAADGAVYGIRSVLAGRGERGALAFREYMEAVACRCVFVLSGIYPGEHRFFQEHHQSVSKHFQAFWLPKRCKMEQ